MSTPPATLLEGKQLLLTAKDVKKLLAISERTLWRWAAQGLLPAPVQPAPRVTRWRAADIQRWLDNLPARLPATIERL